VETQTVNADLNTAILSILDAHVVGDGFYETPIPGLTLMRTSEQLSPRHMHYRPKICIVTQGAKQVMVADQTIDYVAGQTLVVTVEVPVLSQVIDASPAKPFVGATMDLDPEIILDVVTRMGGGSHTQGAAGFGFVVNDLDSQITGSLIRLLDLIGRPHGVEILYPAIMREISYWLLTGPAGRNVARMVLSEGQPMRIAKAIAHLRDNFDTPVSVSDLAQAAGMSASSFHQHFKSLTSMSPLQYQKHLRLLEARRLMVADGEKAGVAALTVGYESVSQFSREYARMFGSPPRRETQRAKGDRTRSDALEAYGAGAAPL
jgi:AraC-like DNA-binding protein